MTAPSAMDRPRAPVDLSTSGDHRLVRVGESLLLFFVESSTLLALDPGRCLDAAGQPTERLRQAVAVALSVQEREAGRLNRDLVRERAARTPNRVSALNLNLTDRCNLACVYCYAKGGGYGRIRDELDLDTFRSAMAEAAGVLDRSRELRFEFFGGEPLLNLETIRQVLEWESDTPGLPARVVNRISTNLTVLTPQMEEVLERGRFILSVSLDGSRETQDAQRPFRDGRGSFDTIIENVRKMKRRAPHLVTVARMTVYRGGSRLLDEIEELRQTDLFDYCSIYAAAIDQDGRGDLVVSPEFQESYLAFAARYDGYLSGRAGRFKGCLELNRYLGHLLLGTAALNHCRAGIGYFSLSADGSVHPCHRLIGQGSRTLPGGLRGVEATPELWRVPVTERQPCDSCDTRYFCGGGCKQENLIATGDPLSPGPSGCAFARLLFDAALVASSTLSGPSRRRLEPICSGLEELFVLCGQEVGAHDRGALRGALEASLAPFLSRSGRQSR
ncbi:MAG: radical SAM protein [Candidatus Riflebacteria bacterium]|nr:radical SAM protein [Candidatus Riflebacteria bacterium]